ncbi:MAG: NADH-quinone oxidoreductase [Alphaproteobacteria bacterium]|nr:NADH-quinone oxidoreductase [Alphaproteobacteria bacterium]
MTIYFFYFFSFLIISSSVFVIFSNNAVHSVLFLIFTFFNSAILFILMNAEFLAMTLVIVYVGAIAVLFLFVVMMLNISESVMKEGFLKYFPFGLILITIFISELFIVFNFDTFEIAENIKIDINENGLLEENNTKLIGLYLYTDYFIIFQISGFILLLAMIGAIVLAKGDEKNIKSNSAINQKTVRKKNIIRLN